MGLNEAPRQQWALPEIFGAKLFSSVPQCLDPFKCDIFTSEICAMRGFIVVRIVCFEKKLIYELPQLLAAMMLLARA